MGNYQNKDIENEINKFNWGAAALNFTWAIANGCYKQWSKVISKSVLISSIVAILVYVLVYPALIDEDILFKASVFVFIISFLGLIAIFFASGKQGNKILADSGDFKTIEELKNSQKIWQIIGITFTVIYTVFILLFGLILIFLCTLPQEY